MEIDEFLFRKKMKMAELSNLLQISSAALFRYKNKITSPSLITSIKLFNLSKGEIDFEHLLNESDREDLKNFMEKLEE